MNLPAESETAEAIKQAIRRDASLFTDPGLRQLADIDLQSIANAIIMAYMLGFVAEATAVARSLGRQTVESIVNRFKKWIRKDDDDAVSSKTLLELQVALEIREISPAELNPDVDNGQRNAREALAACLNTYGVPRGKLEVILSIVEKVTIEK